MRLAGTRTAHRRRLGVLRALSRYRDSWVHAGFCNPRDCVALEQQGMLAGQKFGNVKKYQVTEKGVAYLADDANRFAQCRPRVGLPHVRCHCGAWEERQGDSVPEGWARKEIASGVTTTLCPACRVLLEDVLERMADCLEDLRDVTGLACRLMVSKH